MKIAYLHGLESSIKPKDPKIIFLNNNFDEVYTPSINYRDDKTFDKLFKHISRMQPDLIVGSSMGGYVSYLIGSKLSIPVLLFNPAVVGRSFDPVVDDSNLKRTKIEVMFGKGDTVISGKAVRKYFRDNGVAFNHSGYDGGHRVPADVFINSIKSATGIKEIYNVQNNKYTMKNFEQFVKENVSSSQIKKDIKTKEYKEVSQAINNAEEVSDIWNMLDPKMFKFTESEFEDIFDEWWNNITRYDSVADFSRNAFMEDVHSLYLHLLPYVNESVVTEKREDVGKYNTVKKVVAKLGKRPSEQDLAQFINDNYYDVTEVELGDDDERADDKIADLVGFYKFDIDDWETAWDDAQNESVVTEAYIGPFVFNDRMSDEELKAMYNDALNGYANWQKGFLYPKSDYKKVYQEIEKILKKRGVSVDESVISEGISKDRMIKQIKRALKDGTSIFKLPMDTQKYYNKNKSDFESVVTEGKMPNKFIGNDEIVFLKTKENSRGAHYNLYYKGHDIDKGGHTFGSEEDLKSFADNYILSNQLYNKLKYEDSKPLPESVVTEAKDMTFTDYLKVLDAKFEDAMAAVNGENGSDTKIAPTRGDILQNFTLFRNYVSSLTKKYKGDKTKLRFLTEKVREYELVINESVVNEESEDGYTIRRLTDNLVGGDQADNWLEDNPINFDKLKSALRVGKFSEYELRDVILGKAAKSIEKKVMREISESVVTEARFNYKETGLSGQNLKDVKDGITGIKNALKRGNESAVISNYDLVQQRLQQYGGPKANDFLEKIKELAGLDESVVTESVFSFKTDNVEQLHFETDPKTAELMKIELGKSQGEVSKRKQIESGEYSLRRFRKSINYGDGTYLGVFLPGSYDAAISTLGDGPHKKAVRKVRWTQKKYNQWLEDMASNGGAENAFDMAQNAKNETGLIDWVKKNFREEDPLQRIQWDIEGYAESVVNEASVQAYALHMMADKVGQAVAGEFLANKDIDLELLTKAIRQGEISKYELRDIVKGTAPKSRIKRFLKEFINESVYHHYDFLGMWAQKLGMTREEYIAHFGTPTIGSGIDEAKATDVHGKSFDVKGVSFTYTERGRFYGVYLYDVAKTSNVQWRAKLRTTTEATEFLALNGVDMEVPRNYDEKELDKICKALSKQKIVCDHDMDFDPS